MGDMINHNKMDDIIKQHTDLTKHKAKNKKKILIVL